MAEEPEEGLPGVGGTGQRRRLAGQPLEPAYQNRLKQCRLGREVPENRRVA
jgi:hypothetical protein